jgi:hypothetical protein
VPWLTAAAFAAWTRANPAWVDAIFAARWYPFLVRNMTFINRIRFPVATILTAFAAIWCAAGLIAAVARSFASRDYRPALKAVCRRITAAGCAYLLLYALWGAQYSRSRPMSGATAAVSASYGGEDALPRQCMAWITQANRLAPRVRAPNSILSQEPEDILARVPSAFENARGALPRLIGMTAPAPKPLGFDSVFSSLLIEGMYFPFTFEALVNTSVPAIDLPFVACHEAAHAIGYAREDEANLIAAIVCAESADPVFRYSGVMSSLRYGLSALAARDPGAYWTMLGHMSDGVRADFINRQQYWRERQQTPLARFAARVNDFFLVNAAGAEDGARSYGKVVELLREWERE